MCGILGITEQQPVVQELYDGLLMLQHRGQDSAGMCTYDGQIHVHKGNGLVSEVFREKQMLRLTGNMGIAHTRYTTAGSHDDPLEAQPFYVNSPFGIALIHNGNLTNYHKLYKEVVQENMRNLNTTSDSELIVNVLANEILHLGTNRGTLRKLSAQKLFQAMRRVYQRLHGSFSVIALIAGQGLLAFRDSYGIRPLVFGKRQSHLSAEYCFASETVAFDTLGFELIRNVRPGEVIFIDMKGSVFSQICGKSQKHTPCIFEYIYIARPDSVLDKIGVYKTRLRLGEKLAAKIKKANVPIDVVIPVPDTARSCAIAIARRLGLKYREGLIKNRYVGRTFIMPGQELRKRSVRRKLNPMPLEISGKRVLLVDDSIVRGTTSKQIIQMVRDAGAKKVYFASSAPPIRAQCVYGVDMPTRRELVANNLDIEGIRKFLNADALFYQDIPDMIDAARQGNPKIRHFCTACFTGKYPTKDVTKKLLARVEEEHTRKQDELSVKEHSDDQLPLL